MRVGDRNYAGRLHDSGSKRFGSAWMRANVAAVEILNEFELEPGQHQALGAAIAYTMCTAAQTGYPAVPNLVKVRPGTPPPPLSGSDEPPPAGWVT